MENRNAPIVRDLPHGGHDIAQCQTRQSNFMAERKFSESHEWVDLDGAVATVGITDFAQKELGNIVYLDTMAVGSSIKQGDTFGTIESVKAVSDLIAPISGIIEQINQAVVDSPEVINESAESTAWIIKVRVSDPQEFNSLLDKAAYAKLAEG